MKNAWSGKLQGNCHSVSTTGFGERLDSGFIRRVYMVIVIAFPWLVCLACHLGVQNDTDCPYTHTHTRARARTHTHTHTPLVPLFKLNESWQHCMSQLGKEIDTDDCFDLCHTDGRWETLSWSVFVQMHRSHEVANIRNWQLPGIPVAGNRLKSKPFDRFCCNSTSF